MKFQVIFLHFHFFTQNSVFFRFTSIFFEKLFFCPILPYMPRMLDVVVVISGSVATQTTSGT